jgi:UPF0755 protein
MTSLSDDLTQAVAHLQAPDGAAVRAIRRVQRRRLAAAGAAVLVAIGAGTGIALANSGSSNTSRLVPSGPSTTIPLPSRPTSLAPTPKATPVATTPYTIPAGDNLAQSLPVIARATGLRLADLQAAAANPEALDLPAWARGVTSAEGFLYPGTYQPQRGTSAIDVLKAMVAEFNRKSAPLDIVGRAAAQHVSPLQALTLASIVQKETDADADAGRVARVIYNRLSEPQYFPYLGMDSTTRYATGNYDKPLTLSELDDPSPYNTRLRPGIPPGPIGSPAVPALVGVLDPPPGPWVYFLYLPAEKQTFFTDNTNDFQLLEARRCREAGTSC